MNHDPDPSAARRRAQPPSPLPPAWRAEILAAATPPRQLIRFPANPWGCSLAAAWTVIAALRLATPGLPAPPPAVALARQSDPAFPAALAFNEFTLRTRLLAGQNLERGLP